MKCRIDKGGKQVFTPNNERSKLFDKLYNIMGKDFQKALDVYSITETPEFKDYQDVLSKVVPNARVESTDPIVFQSVLERLQQNGLSDNIFQLNTKDMLNKVKGLINPRFIIDVRGIQIGRQFNIRKTDEELRQILKQGGRFPIEDIVDISSMKNLVPNMDFSNTYIEFNYDNNWKSEISATLLVSGREIRGIKFDYAEVGNIRAELYILLGHELQHAYDIANQLPSGASIKEINNQVQQRFGDISGRIKENSGEHSLSAENGVGLGIYLAKRGEQRARINSLQEFGIPNSKNDEYEPRIKKDLLWDDFSEVKEQDLQNYYDIAINYYYNTRNPANEVITPIPNGFVVTENRKRNIHLNSDNLNLDTLLHENRHLFLDTLKQRFPEHYQAGLELLTKNSVEAQPYADYVNATQPSLERYSEAWKNEVLAQIIGSKGEQLIKSRKKNTIKEWLNDFWDFVAKSFGLTSYTPTEVANMTLQEFSDAVNTEMLNGNSQAFQTNTTEQELQQIKAFNEGVEAVAEIANEYKKEFGIDSVQHNKVNNLFPAVSKMISEAYEQSETGMTTEEVKEAYKALEEETLQQYKFIVDKGLKVSRWTGEGEPYPNSKSMLKDVRENNHLYFLPNSEAFGKEGDEVEDRAGLKMTDVYLKDGYRMTLSEVFRVVHDYFGHGILGNQFGAVGEENATLQHLDLYSFKALPAVIFQTRGQNSWVNFSGVNDEALRKIKEGSKTNNKK